MSALRTQLRAVSRLAASPVAVLTALAAVLVIRPQTDPDYWWHLRIGDWILDHGTVPHVDLLSWLANGPWIAHEWADEVLFAAMQRGLGSPMGSVILFALVGLACLALVAACARLMRPGLSAMGAAVIVLMAALAAIPIWGPRGQMWDILFSLVLLRVLLGYFDHGEQRALWALPALLVAWANLHGGGVDFAWVVFGAVLAGEWWNRRLTVPADPRPSFRPVLWSLLASTAAMAINPYGLAIYTYPLGTVGSGAMANLILEWNSPDFHSLGFRPAQILLSFGLIAGLSLSRMRDGRVLILVSGLTLLFLQSARYVGLWAPLSMAVAGPAILDAAASLIKTLGLHGHPRPRWNPAVLLAARMTCLALALSFLITGAAVLPNAGDRQLAQSEPVAAAEWLGAHKDILASGRLWNSYSWGGYLSWKLGVQVGPYGAADSFGDATLEELDALGHMTVDPAPFLDAHQVEIVIYPVDRPLAFWLAANPAWRLVYHDEVAVIYTRVSPLP